MLKRGQESTLWETRLPAPPPWHSYDASMPIQPEQLYGVMLTSLCQNSDTRKRAKEPHDHCPLRTQISLLLTGGFMQSETTVSGPNGFHVQAGTPLWQSIGSA